MKETAEPESCKTSGDPVVSYIVITRNRSSELGVCLRSIRAQEYSPSETVVVDNASEDDTCEMVSRDFPEVKLVKAGYNAGVAGGRNIAMRAARGDIYVSLDDDAEFADRGAGTKIVNYLCGQNPPGIISFRILDGQTGETQRSTIPRVDKCEPEKPTEVAYFSGGGHAIHSRVVMDTGPYPSRYFYAGEELALAYRALEAGWRILFTPDIKVMHYNSETARPGGQRIYRYVQSRVWLPLQFLPWRYALFHAAAWYCRIGWEALRNRTVGSFLKGTGAMLRGLPSVLREREMVSDYVVNKLKKLSGRLWW